MSKHNKKMERERVPVLCALIAIALLGVRLRDLALAVAMAGITALVWDEAYVPLRYRGTRACGKKTSTEF